MSEPIFGNFDLALIALYLFWAFFAALIIYLQRENMREGYPLEMEDGSLAPNQGPFPVPDRKKTFHLPHGRGDVTVPDDRVETRELALHQPIPVSGYPFEPTGDPMADGVGPASWAARQDWPELDGHGHVKIVPMRMAEAYHHAAGRDPRGMDVLDRHGKVVGKVTDMWVDKPELLVRYLEMELPDGGHRLIPINSARIMRKGVSVRNLTEPFFARVPTTKSDSQITLLEEEKIMAFYAGGQLYAG
ncbi:photosynthetic reaction center subunit H [Halovulum dunhuangense]|uniref:Photosynthetic reaction center subunit H n=1 Tax=Halovulum dunhuangense TaxID=1505036 RepID=A0A849KUS3_9RHOB|nr:photosynthetic reaction center subunit H [Halovulum dunhuangense]NNU79371.1 photosynthetic reaction center subunit H [Halovulum dunhuangense]